jgi:hypothetical protein
VYHPSDFNKSLCVLYLVLDDQYRKQKLNVFIFVKWVGGITTFDADDRWQKKRYVRISSIKNWTHLGGCIEICLNLSNEYWWKILILISKFKSFVVILYTHKMLSNAFLLHVFSKSYGQSDFFQEFFREILKLSNFEYEIIWENSNINLPKLWPELLREYKLKKNRKSNQKTKKCKSFQKSYKK